MTGGPHVAVDLGAASGRVMLGAAGPGRLELREVHRFANDPISLPDGLHWDTLRLYHDILEGLRRAGRADYELQSIGIDAWGVDYGLLDDGGRLLGNPHHYRDPRTAAGVEDVHGRVPHERLYARNGLQFMPFNTIYQLAASRGTFEFEAAATMLLTPDLIGYWLTGAIGAEETMASTTGLLDALDRTWALDLVATLDIPAGILPPLARPGQDVGALRDEVAVETGLPAGIHVTHVGSHDTASAVVAVPAEGSDFAYISSGTWSLVGVELDAPVLGEASRLAQFTNERGVDDRVRYLRNVMGLWLLQETLRAWERAGTPEDLGALLEAASDLPTGGPLVEPNDPAFLPPGDMPGRIVDACRRTDQPVPDSRPGMVRCILDSLATAYAKAIDDARRLSGRDVRVVHVVGGGSQNSLLCQLTADACGLPIVAGPVEATALGNVLVQARAHGGLSGDLETLRALVRATQPLRRFEPAARGATPVG
ncbi:MAG TPA: rhamnulokinase family protein [Candidatus Limnocylindrales bacterium]